jgi:hypothetical protein
VLRGRAGGVPTEQVLVILPQQLFGAEAIQMVQTERQRRECGGLALFFFPLQGIFHVLGCVVASQILKAKFGHC